MTRLAVAFAALLVLATATPAVAAPDGVDLAVTVTFDKPAYHAYEQINATVTVTNDGTAPATGVKLIREANAPFGTGTWSPLDSAGPGATVAPGERIELPYFVEVYDVVDVVRMTATVRTPDAEADTTNNTASAEAAITVRRTDLVGTLYGDRDGDKRFDPGEGMSGVRIESDGGRPVTDISTRTDANGRFSVPNVPEGSYPLRVSLPGGWQTDETAMVLLTVEGGEVFVRAVLDSSALRGSITFDKQSYQVGETVHEHVTLTNTGGTDLAGVTARCVEGAGPNQLSGLGWGDLVHYEGPGVTVRAGETRTFDFTDVVPPGGRLYGFITLTCWFSTAYRYDDGPKAMARAEVPGGRGSTGGVLFVDRDDDAHPSPGEALANVKLFLVGHDGQIAGRAVTDPNGHFMFAGVPANDYYLRLTGPWRFREGVGLRVGVFDGDVTDNLGYAVEPGPNQLDPDSPPPSAGEIPRLVSPAPPAAPIERPEGLADTGADVVELLAFGFLLVAVGLLLVRRRNCV